MRRLIVIPFIFITLSLFAAPIGEQKAREIALKFFGTSGTRTSSVVLEMEWAGSDIESVEKSGGVTRSSAVGSENDVEEALVYIYNRVDTKGFVVVAGDDKVKKPILAFSYDNTFDVENMPDGAKAILQAWCQQVAAIRTSNRLSAATRADDTSVGNIVCKHETALWNQRKPYNNETPVFDGEELPCGCVATASGIICRYYEWPEKGVGTTPEYTYKDDIGVQRTIPANELGRIYDYSKLKMDYKDGYTEEEGAMVAALLYDLGTSFRMKFGQDGSGANTSTAAASLVKYFSYSKGTLYISHLGRSEEEWSSMLQKNISEYGPTQFRGNSQSGGHSFVLDGYTDQNYFSINYGWGGSSNGYYLLPNISYYKNQGAIFYLKPDKDGTSEYRDYVTLQAYTANSGNVYRGVYTTAKEYKVGLNFRMYVAMASSGLADFYGYICVAHCDKSGNIKEIICTKEKTATPLKSTASGFNSINAISKSIEEGDRLRVFYKGINSDEWVRALSGESGAYDEVLLWATPQEVAKSLKISYEKDSKIFTFASQHSIQYSITNASGSVVKSGKAASFNTTEIDLSELESGIYTFSFASGGEPYKLNIKL